MAHQTLSHFCSHLDIPVFLASLTKPMPKYPLVLINWLALLAVLAVNILSVVLPLNELQADQISALYPNLFVPAGFTFAIWGFIYLLLIAHVIFCTRAMRQPHLAEGPVGQLIKRIHPFFIATCLFNSGWLLAWHYLHIGLSVLIMLALFSALLAIFHHISQSEKTHSLNYVQHVTLETPFIIYFAWISVALIANISGYLVSIGWQGAPLEGWVWSCIMLGIAGAIGAWLSIYWRRPAFTAVIVWGLFGVYSAQANKHEMIGYAALASMSICIVSAGIGFWQKRSLVLHNIQPARAERGFNK